MSGSRCTALRVVSVLAVLVVVPLVAPSTSDAATLPQFSDVTVTSDVVYQSGAVTWDGVPVDLTLDLYEGVGDSRTDRPLVIWMHGGSFAFGDKTDALDVGIATELARRGVVAASLNYRLGPEIADGGIGGISGNPTIVGAILRALEDARSAIWYLRSNAGSLGIDPDLIFIAGASAGAVTSINAGYLYDNSAGAGGPDDPYRVAGVLSMAGTSLPIFPQAGEPPLFMAHGTEDKTVPYAEGVAFCDAANDAGVPCEFHSYPTDHMGLADYTDDVMDKAEVWLLDRLDEIAAAQATTTTTTTTPSTSSPTSTTASRTPFASRAPVATSVSTATPAFTG